MGHRIHTQVDIEAPIEEVWAVLSDWPSYPQWNPWMVRLEGRCEVGERLDVGLKLGDKTMRFRPRLVDVQPGRAFRWLGHTFIRGLFDGEHAFELEPLTPQRTRFVHSEAFSGLLAGMVLRSIGEATEAGFRTMNEALKTRCETGSASVPSSV